MLCFAEGELPAARLKQAEKDLFINHISKKLSYYIKKPPPCHCFMWNILVIDENGQLLLCCGITNKDSDHILGNVLEMSAEDMLQKKLGDSICRTCISFGVPRALGAIGHKPLPPGGRSSYFTLWYQINLPNGYLCYMRTKIVGMIEYLPGGGKFVRMIRNVLGIIRGTQ